MSDEKELQEETVETVEQANEKTPFNMEEFYENNKKAVSIGAGVVALLVLGAVYVFAKWLPEQTLKAQTEMRYAEFSFAKDSFNLALNGRTSGTTPFKGFAFIAKEYSLTKPGKLASHYAGICCLNLKKYQDAVDYLDKASVNDPVIGAVRLSALGDAYAELGKMDDAVNYYQKAANYATNDIYTPFFLMKAGMAFEKQGKKEEAQKLYEKIRDEYPNTEEGRDIEKYIARVGGN